MILHKKLLLASNEYLNRLKSQNLSRNTIQNYRNVVQSFADFVGETEQTDEYVAVVAWKTRLFENGLSPTTIKQYLVSLQIFFSAVSHRSYPEEIRFGDNPIDKTLLPKIPDRPYPTILTDEQVVLLFKNEPPTPHYKPMWPMTWAILMLLLNEKIRVSELTELRLSDLDYRDHILTVRSGKGRKYREVDLTELSELAVERYLNSGLRPSDISDDDFLFGNTASKVKGDIGNKEGALRWHKFSTTAISQKVERVVEEITGEPNVRSHDLRKIGSRVCLNAGQSMEELQGALGHSNINTTQIYTHRMGSRKGRESAKSVLAARDAAAKRLQRKNELAKQKTEQTTMRYA